MSSEKYTERLAKYTLFAVFFALTAALTAENAPVVKMAVFPDNTVFTVRKGVIPDGKDFHTFLGSGVLPTIPIISTSA